MIFLISCGAKKKVIQNEKQEEKINLNKKVDSSSIKKEEKEIQKNIVTKNDDFFISVSKSKEVEADSTIKTDSLVKKNTSKVKIKTPTKEVELEVPWGYDYNINSTNLDKKEEEINKIKTSDSTFTNKNINEEINNKKESRVSDSDRKEAVSFNRTFAIVLGIIILIIIIYFYIRYKLTKP